MSVDGNRFVGKVVIVTGGGSGIGAATAYRFGREGAAVVAVGRSEDRLKEAAADAPAGARVLTRVADVSEESSITVLITDVAEEYGRLDVLVNNAGG
ncbi:SDR family oxidoreductase [Streptomyces sp. NPDC003077]|uniref:SDR family oxidoreductase n=1 Tax=Streptomyces sp. NPDC003077 TaxID=3154443 RepID=UPI0033BDAF9D